MSRRDRRLFLVRQWRQDATAVYNHENPHQLAFALVTVHYTIGCDDQLADIGMAVLRDDTPHFWMLCQRAASARMRLAIALAAIGESWAI
jgi:hypothetical protein